MWFFLLLCYSCYLFYRGTSISFLLLPSFAGFLLGFLIFLSIFCPFRQKELQAILKMTMREVMLQKKRQMMMRMHSLILVIFSRQVLLKAVVLICGHHLSPLMKSFILLNLRMMLTLLLNQLERTFLMLSVGRGCLSLLRRRKE